MADIINVSALMGGIVVKTNLFLNNDIIFVENNILEDDSKFPKILDYKGIKKLNTRTLKIEDYSFKSRAGIVSFVSSASTIYYGKITNEENKSSILIYKVHCDNMVEEEIIKINLDIKNEALSDSYIVGLNERYAILFIPHSTLVYGRPFFNKGILIDSFEKKTYDIPDKINELDTLLRVDEAWISNDSQNILFKTGRIRPDEKKRIWDEQAEKGTFNEYHDHIESIMAFDINELVGNIKKGIQINKTDIIDTCDMHKAINIISVTGNVNYSINDFKTKQTEIKTIDFQTKKMLSIKCNSMFDYILGFDNAFHGITLTDNKEQEVYSIEKNRVVFSTNKNIAYIDKENIITFEIKKQSLNRIFSIYNLQKNEEVQTMEGRILEYEFGSNELILY